MEEWTKLGDKKIKVFFEGKIAVVAPKDMNNIVPLFCPCCDFPMKTSDDSVSYRKVGVCNKCDGRWTNKPNVEWPDGPNKSSKEWTQYINDRTIFERTVINFK